MNPVVHAALQMDITAPILPSNGPKNEPVSEAPDLQPRYVEVESQYYAIDLSKETRDLLESTRGTQSVAYMEALTRLGEHLRSLPGGSS